MRCAALKFSGAMTLERLISVIGVLVLLGGILITAGAQMERIAQLRAEVAEMRMEQTAMRIQQSELKQKIESVMLFVGESEARRWRENRKAAR